jgi:hypothetical protein
MVRMGQLTAVTRPKDSLSNPCTPCRLTSPRCHIAPPARVSASQTAVSEGTCLKGSRLERMVPGQEGQQQAGAGQRGESGRRMEKQGRRVER